MIVYIHSHEMIDTGRTFGRHSGVPPTDIRHIVVPLGTDVNGIIALVQAQVTNPRSIWLLIFNGHGDDSGTGAFLIGQWIEPSSMHNFRPLSELMNGFGYGVEVHCCRSSKTSVQELARAFQTRVIGSVNDQVGLVYLRGTEIIDPVGGDRYGLIEGIWVAAYPDGRVYRIDR